MIDLNELKIAVDRDKVDVMNIPVVIRNGQIVDYLTVDDIPRKDENIQSMPLIEVLIKVFFDNMEHNTEKKHKRLLV